MKGRFGHYWRVHTNPMMVHFDLFKIEVSVGKEVRWFSICILNFYYSRLWYKSLVWT